MRLKKEKVEDGIDIRGYSSGGSPCGHTETFCGRRGRFISPTTVVLVFEKEDIWHFIANVGDADPPAVDIGEDNSPIITASATEVLEHRCGVRQATDDGLYIAGRRQVRRHGLESPWSRNILNGWFRLHMFPRGLRPGFLCWVRLPGQSGRLSQGTRLLPRVGIVRHQGSVVEQRILVDSDTGGRGIPHVPFEATLRAVTHVSAKRALPFPQLRVEIDVVGISKTTD